MKTTHTYTGTTVEPTQYEAISSTEAQLLYPNLTPSPTTQCYKKEPTIAIAGVTGPPLSGTCIKLHKYDHTNKFYDSDELKNKLKNGQNISPTPNVNDKWYIGYNLSNKGNKNIGTTTENLLSKLRDTNSMPPDTIIKDTKDIDISCNQQSYFHSTNARKYVNPTEKGILELGGCVMNQCYDEDDKPQYAIDKPDLRCEGNLGKFRSDSDDNQQVKAGIPKNMNPTPLQCNVCPIFESENECNNNKKCFWYKSEGDSVSACKNKCGVRETKGQCEQFYIKNNPLKPKSLYEFDGTDDKCRWHPMYNNIDDSVSSRDGLCHDVDAPCVLPKSTTPTSNSWTTMDDATCNIHLEGKIKSIPGTINDNNCYPDNIKDYFKNVYCKHNHVLKNEELCSKSDDKQDKCIQYTNKFKCVSDANLHTNKGKTYYKTDADCAEYTTDKDCRIAVGCISKPHNPKLFKAKQPTPKSYNDLNAMCTPLRAQISNNYDINLLAEEKIPISDYNDSHNKKPPYLTSKYLCDICSIRNKDLKYINDDVYNLNNSDNKKEYCEKGIDKDNPDKKKPCKYTKEGQCISVCKAAISNPTDYTQLTNMKKQCIKTPQYSENTSNLNSAQFPNYNNRGKEDTSKYYDDLFCSWDGFECHNSIPCKETQRIRCEDLGYDWYEGNVTNISYQSELKGDNPLDLSESYPVKHKGDGKPIKSDSDGICIFPNMQATFHGDDGNYVIDPIHKGQQGILLKWREYGTGWWNDSTLFNKRKYDTTTNKPDDETQYFIGEHIIFIQYEVDPYDAPSKIMDKINERIKNYQYYALNGEYVVWAEDIYNWVIDNYVETFSPTLAKTPANSRKLYCGYNYYCEKPLNSNPFQNSTPELTPGALERQEWKDIFMCNVIYDLRGTIPLIPVIKDQALLQIEEFNITPEGKISFEMHANRKHTLHGYDDVSIGKMFVFDKFIDANIFNSDKKKEHKNESSDYYLTVLSKYNYCDGTVGDFLPKNIVTGYGNLYDYFEDPSETHTYYKPYTDVKESLKDKKTIKTAYDNILSNISSDNKETGITDKVNWGLFDELIQYHTFVDDGIPERSISVKSDLFDKCIVDNKNEKTFGTGSIENMKIAAMLGTVKITPPTYQKVPLNKTRFMYLLQLYNNTSEKTRKGASSHVTLDADSDGTLDIKEMLAYDYTDKQKQDIRKASIWSMTRNTHPYFGDLIYNPYTKKGSDIHLPYIDTEQPNHTYINNNTDINQTYKKHLLGPFNDETIPWEKIMTYFGGNKNKVIRHKDLTNPNPKVQWSNSGFEQGELDNILKVNNTTSNEFYFKITQIDYIDLAPGNDKRLKDPKNDSITVNKLLFLKKDKIKSNKNNYYIPGNWLERGSKTDNDANRYYWKITNPNLENIIEYGPFESAATGKTPQRKILLETGPELNMLRILFIANYATPSPINHWPQDPDTIKKCTYLKTLFLENPGRPADGWNQTGDGSWCKTDSLVDATNSAVIDDNDQCKNIDVTKKTAFLKDGNGNPKDENIITTRVDKMTYKDWIVPVVGTYKLFTGAKYYSYCPDESTCSEFFGGKWESNHCVQRCNNAYSGGNPDKFGHHLPPQFHIKSDGSKPPGTLYPPPIDNWKRGLKDHNTNKYYTRNKELGMIIPIKDDLYNYIKDNPRGTGSKTIYNNIIKNILNDTDLNEDELKNNKYFTENCEGDYQQEGPKRNTYLDKPVGWPDLSNYNYNTDTISTTLGFLKPFKFNYESSAGSNDLTFNVIPTKPKPTQYPGWINDGKKTCQNLLAYVPNKKDNNTIKEVSINNCALPIINNQGGWLLGSPLLNNYTAFASTDNTQTIRTICQDTCAVPHQTLKTGTTDPITLQWIYNFPDNDHRLPVQTDSTVPIINLFTNLNKETTTELKWEEHTTRRSAQYTEPIAGGLSIKCSSCETSYPEWAQLALKDNSGKTYTIKSAKSMCDNELQLYKCSGFIVDTGGGQPTENTKYKTTFKMLNPNYKPTAKDKYPNLPYDYPEKGSTKNIPQWQDSPLGTIKYDDYKNLYTYNKSNATVSKDYNCALHSTTIPSPATPSPQPIQKNISSLQSYDSIFKDLYKNDDYSCKISILNRLNGRECNGKLTPTPSCIQCLQNSSNVSKKCKDKQNLIDNACDSLSDMDSNTYDNPWFHQSPKLPPSDRHNKYENISPYNNKNDRSTCIIPSDKNPHNIQFTHINPVDDSGKSFLEFYKPYRSDSSKLFGSKSKSDKYYDYGCIRKDIMEVDESYYKLNCNTNTSYPIERDKYRMINFIIHNDKTKSLNISDRTKLAVMDEEELLRKAEQLDIDMSKLNEYTRPQLVSNVKDIWNPNMRPNAPTGYKGGFEIWNDLEEVYLNLPNTTSKTVPKFGLKVWNYEGCALDFNDADSSSSFESCKDRYPGLCEYNKHKCDSPFPEIKKAIRLDCPETCNTQFTSLDAFSNKQIGDLSICSGRGRCKWSKDQDASNLLPECDTKSSREYGNNKKCEQFSTLSIGECLSDIKSDVCLEQKCLSMNGCVYSKPNSSACHIPIKILSDKTSRDCYKSGGTWSGTAVAGNCIIKDYYDTKITKEQCAAEKNSKWIKNKDALCTFNPHSWTPLEDPCGLPYNSNCEKITNPTTCNNKQFCKYSNITKSCTSADFDTLPKEQRDKALKKLNNPIPIKKLIPECHNKDSGCSGPTPKSPPDAFKLIINNNNINKGDYINITNGRDTSKMCNPLISGHSLVLDAGGTFVIIKGPNTTYTLATNEYNEYEIGNCVISEIYSFEDNKHPQKSRELCESNKGGSCTYVDKSYMVDGDYEGSTNCMSCSLIKTRNECITNNKTSSCGWGEIRNVCEVIGNIGECNDMYVEGCAWDTDREMCTLNPAKDDDGDQGRQSEGCMKCDDIQHRHTCDSLSNCFWNKSITGKTVKGHKKGVCQSCSKLDSKSCIEDTGGQCQWRTNKTHYTKKLDEAADNLINKLSSDPQYTDKPRCYASRLYPFIYQWIWYNRTYLLCLIACIIILWKLPTPPSPMKYGVWILKLIIMVVTIPALSALIVRADGIDGREKYIDPPIKSENPGLLDFIHDQNQRGAKWPAVFYNDEWDNMVMDQRGLRDLVDFKVGPWILDWTKPLWMLLSKWNDIVNTLGDHDIIFIFACFIIFLACIYSIGFIRVIKQLYGSKLDKGMLSTEHSTSWTIIIIGVSVLLTIYGYHIFKKRKEYIDREKLHDINNKLVTPYKGNQVKPPTDPTSIMGTLSTLPTAQMCPYGCFQVDGNGKPGKPCADTRSFFAFRGSWEPNPKKNNTNKPYKTYKYLWNTTDNQYICPPDDHHTRYPYEQLCKTTQCHSKGTETTVYYKEADEKCKRYYDKYNTCDKYSDVTDKTKQKELTYTYTDNSLLGSAPPTTINLNCTLSVPSGKDNCPFKRSMVKLDEVDDYHSRQPINIWQIIYDKMAGPTGRPKRRLSQQEKINWQNQFRYDIVDQNYSHDTKKI